METADLVALGREFCPDSSPTLLGTTVPAGLHYVRGRPDGVVAGWLGFPPWALRVYGLRPSSCAVVSSGLEYGNRVDACHAVCQIQG